MGSRANEQLTSLVAAVLLVLLAVESVTLLNLRSLLTVHAFVGMLLIPVVGLKLASTGWRMARYYVRADEYVLRGPPHVALRVFVAPVVVVSTVFLFGTGVALLVLERTEGPIVLLHKASFIVWLGATGLHVLAHLVELLRALRTRVPGLAVRLGAVGTAVAAGALLAVASLPAADHLQDRATSHLRFDGD
jgi:hypothetical protein